MRNTLSREEVRRFYDRFGAKQDKQGYYEDSALDALIEHGGFASAQAVFEIGCGTGRLGARLLSDYLPDSARYVGIDLSATMVSIARDRLAPWSKRAQIHLSSGDFDFASFGGAFDRVVCTYVFDLLSRAQITEALAGAHAALSKGGLLCTAGLTKGSGLLSGATSRMWTLVHNINPAIVGGCRPVVITDFISEHHWRIVYKKVIVSVTVPSQVVIAEAR